MTQATKHVPDLGAAKRLADAVLYEGYVLYPYRASAVKNRVRWQWGVLMPPAAVALDPSERIGCRTDVVLDGRAPTLRASVRLLQVQHRIVENSAGVPVERLVTPEAEYVAWDESREQELGLDLPLDRDTSQVLDIAGGREVEQVPGGRLVRTCEPLRVRVETEVRRPPSPYPVVVVSLRVTNVTDVAAPGPRREDWLRHALVAVHLLLETDARFLSMLDPPEWAGAIVAECRQEGLFPVLADDGDRVVLASPIILYDHASVAPESETGFFDALEVDELLSLRTATLTETERAEVRGTDPRAAALLSEVDAMPAELWDRLHGTVHYLDQMTAVGAAPASPAVPEAPWWDPGSDASVDPEHDTVRVGAVEIGRGDRVLLRPGRRRADAHDLFLAGRTATVAAVLKDVDGHDHLAVTVDDDPGADLKTAHGRYLYFAPDEVEPLAQPRTEAAR